MSKLIAKRYEIIKTLGHGGMADVYLALDTVLNREVAIKILKPDMSSDPVSLERFNREAHASTTISHPNIVDIYDVGEEDDQHYIVMEYIKGYSLKQLIQRRGAIPHPEAVWMIKQLAGALMEAHKHGLIHRDIKSQNVLIKDDGTIKLVDFGIAVLNNSNQLTSKDSVLGSVHYLAPELAKGETATMNSDIYSLGIVFYELLTGDVPFKADNAVQIALMHVKNPLPDVRRFNSLIPNSVVAILEKATAKDVDDRYENVAFMLKDLNTCLDGKKNDDEENMRDINNKRKKGKKKNKDKFTTILIVAITIFSIGIIASLLFITGIFDFNNKNEIKVPEIVGLRYASALDALDAAEIEVDFPIDHIFTDDIAEGIIVAVSPSPGSVVSKGTKVKITISDGIYSIMSDYVGKSIEEVKTIFEGTNITVKIVAVEDYNNKAGIIISQTGILAGDKYNPNEPNKIIFDVAYPSTVNIPYGILGKDLDEAVAILMENGFNVDPDKISKDEFSDEELNNCKSGEVCKIDPEEGSVFAKTPDSVIKLYYYSED